MKSIWLRRVGVTLGLLVVVAGIGWLVIPQILERGSDSYAGESHSGTDGCCPTPATPGDSCLPGCDEAELSPVEALDLDALQSLRCEHDTPTFRCPECRYEIGVVRVDAVLLEGGSGEETPLVRTAEVGRGSISRDIRITGSVELDGNHSAHISPRIPGVIQSVAVDVGARVRKNDVLVEITSVELGQALCDYEKSRALLALSRKSLDREESLFEKKISTERSLIEARMEHEKRIAELAAAEHKLVALGMSEDDIAAVQSTKNGTFEGRLKVRAPFDGTIVEKHAVVGELVAPSKPVLLLSDLRKVWVWANVYGRDLAPLLDRQEESPIILRITVDEFPSRVFEGEFDYFGATMDSGTRTMKVRATVDNRDLLLRPGMFCSVTAQLPSSVEGIVVPTDAVLEDAGSLFVFRHLTEDLFVRRAVETGLRGGGSIEITHGLEGNETIVSVGAFLLKSDVLREKMGAGCAD